jgi:hypothetical protein
MPTGHRLAAGACHKFALNPRRFQVGDGEVYELPAATRRRGCRATPNGGVWVCRPAGISLGTRPTGPVHTRRIPMQLHTVCTMTSARQLFTASKPFLPPSRRFIAGSAVFEATRPGPAQAPKNLLGTAIRINALCRALCLPTVPQETADQGKF